MERNIITTISFHPGVVAISVLEKLSTNVVEIFNDSADISKVNTFIEISLSHVEKLIGGKVSKATFVVDPSNTVEQNISLQRDAIQIVGETVSKLDIENLIQLITDKNSNNSRRTILVQPLKFEVKDIMTKSYSSAPIHKPGNILTITTSVTTISKQAYEFVQQTAKAVGIEVAQILLSNQTVAFANLSKNALTDGTVLIDINDNQVNITVNKNNSIVASMSLYDYGFKYLIKGIMLEFNCSEESARDLVAAHASVRTVNKRVIYSKQIGSDDWSFTNFDLENIIKKYLLKLVAIVKKYITQKNVDRLPIVISGKLNKVNGLTNFLIEKMQAESIIVHNPISFIGMNEFNTNSLGVIEFIEIIDNVLGRQYDTIVHTNPNTLKSLRSTHQPKGWITRFKNKIGGKHEWN